MEIGHVKHMAYYIAQKRPFRSFYFGFDSSINVRRAISKSGETPVFLDSTPLFLGEPSFISHMKELLKRLGKEGVNYIEYRELDRALWVYGHGFKE